MIIASSARTCPQVKINIMGEVDMETQAQSQPQVAPILITAWTRYAQFNSTSLKRTKLYLTMRRWIIVIGISATLLAILVESYPSGFPALGGLVLKALLVAAPLLGSILASFTSKKLSNGDWLITRAGAEEILKEIYMFRTVLKNDSGRKAWLEKRLIEIQRQVYRGMGGELILKPYDGQLPPYYDPGDANSDYGFDDILGDDYFKYRLGNQLSWHIKKINQHETERTRLLLFILFSGATSALLGAFGFNLWVTLAVSLTAGMMAWQELRNLDEVIRNYSKVIMELTIVNDHWSNLEQEERTVVEFNKMVKSTEDVLWNQNIEYIKSMQEVLSDDSLEREASLVNRVIKESVDSAERTKQAIADATVEFTEKSMRSAEKEFVETYKNTLNALAEEASSELIQAELDAMQNAIEEAAQKISDYFGISSSLKAIADEFAGVEIGRDTPMSVINDLMSRYPKTTDVKG